MSQRIPSVHSAAVKHWYKSTNTIRGLVPPAASGWMRRWTQKALAVRQLPAQDKWHEAALAFFLNTGASCCMQCFVCTGHKSHTNTVYITPDAHTQNELSS